MGLAVVYEGLEDGGLGENDGIAHDDLTLAGTSEGDIETAVDEGSADRIKEGGRGEELQLVFMAHGEAVDDDVALRALIALDGVNSKMRDYG